MSDTKPIPSDEQLHKIMRTGAEKMVVQGAAGLVIGLAAGIVLSRGGGTSARKVLAGLGAGAGMGSGWTKTSMQIDNFLASQQQK